jgi:hypothetical protein
VLNLPAEGDLAGTVIRRHGVFVAYVRYHAPAARILYVPWRNIDD